ncbi:peptidylprolyl isomerase [Candidatus Williamhamiltonella defendens]|uniref:peptidylprolyl isomerase n=1 Tax=Candidatus Williamhamiltonella defendens TaxID=138072 RepID=UPI00130EB4BB|nr:peptidylprolyl isomerase [Candidatus Hamiltonella defensa]
MMESFQTSTKNLTLKIILFFIVLSFITGGLGSYFIGKTTDYVAKVNGEKISLTQLEQALQNERQSLQQQLGEHFLVLADNKDYMRQLRKKVIDQLINHILIVQYTHHLGLKIDDEHVKDTIRKISYFQTENQFDNKKYLNLINNMGYTPDEFAELQRQQLINDQLLQVFGNSEFVLPNEIKRISALLLQKRHVRMATLNLNTFQNRQQVTDEEIKDYYDKNKNTFTNPEQIKVSFIIMDAESMENKITVNKLEIKNFYEQHSAEFIQPNLKNYSVIQLKTKKEAYTTLDQLKKGAIFSDLAKNKSIDSLSRKQGGQLGWLEPDTTVDEIKQAHLTEKGQLSDVIESSTGYFIFRLNDIKPSYVKPLSIVRNQLIKKIKQEKAIRAYYVLQKITEKMFNEHKSLASVEAVSGLKAQHTAFFGRNDVPSELNIQPVIKAIFDSDWVAKKTQTAGDAEIINLDGNRAVIIRVDEHKPKRIEHLEKVRDKVQKQIRAQKAQKQILIEGEKFLTALKEGKGKSEMKSAGLSFSEEKSLSYNSDHNALIESIFALNLPTKNKPVYGFSFDQHNNGVLIEFLSVTEGELTSSEKQNFISNIKASYNIANIEALVKNLRREADIQIRSFDDQ